MEPSEGAAADYLRAYSTLSRKYTLTPFSQNPPPVPPPTVTGVFKNVVVICSIQRDDRRLPTIPCAYALPGVLPEMRTNFSGFHAVKVPYDESAGRAVLLVYGDGMVNSTGARSELRTALSVAWLLNTLRMTYGTGYSVATQFTKTNTVVCAALPWLINLDLLRKWEYTAGHAAAVFPGVFIHLGKIATGGRGPFGREETTEKPATVSLLIYSRCVIISGMTDLEEANMLLMLLIPALEQFRRTQDASPSAKRLRTQ
jgi:hypothetical protein